MDYSLKFKELRLHYNLTQAALASELDISRAVVSQIELKNHKPTLDILTSIIKKFDVDIKFFFDEDYNLLGEKIQPLNEPESDNNAHLNNAHLNAHPNTHLSDTNALLKDKKSVPVITEDKKVLEVPGGIPFYETLPASAGDIKSFLDTQQPTSFINMPQISDCSAVLPVYGSSMRGIIEPGDLIAVKELTARSQFDPCLPYLIITTDHRMIKYLRSDAEDATIIWAESTNHKPIKLNADTILYIYIIKCVIRFF